MSSDQRLQLIYESKEKEWERTLTVLTLLRQARLIESDTLKQFKLDEEIKIFTQKLSEIEQELNSLENQLAQIKKDSGKSDESWQIPNDIQNTTSDNSEQQSKSSPRKDYSSGNAEAQKVESGVWEHDENYQRKRRVYRDALQNCLEQKVALSPDVIQRYLIDFRTLLGLSLEDVRDIELEEVGTTLEEMVSTVETFSPEIPHEDIYEVLPEEVKAVIQELQQRLERAKGKTFTFLLIGRTGVGKSSTINSLMGDNVAPVGRFDPCTLNVAIHETNLHGAIVRVIDTPGLCDEIEEVGNDAKYIELIRQSIPYTIDAVLFVSRLDDNRVDASEKRGLSLITKAFGELFWKKSVIVFTRSDKVSDAEFKEYLSERTKRIHAALLALQLSEDTVYKIPSVAVDNTNPEKINPDGQKWIQQFYKTVLDRVENSSKEVFLLSTSHMLEKVGVAPLSVAEKLGVAGAAINSGMAGSYLAYLLGVGSTSVGTTIGAGGTMVTGTLLITNPVGWAVVLGSATLGAVLAHRHLKKNKDK